MILDLGCFLLQFAIHPFSTNWQSAGVSECSCSKYRFLQQPGIYAVCLFTKLLDMLDCRQPSWRQENTEEMLMFISSLQRGCQPCFSFAGTTCVFSSLLRPVFHVQRQSCRYSETSLWLRTCVFSSSSIICFLIFNFPKEDCFLSGFVENWRFSVDV